MSLLYMVGTPLGNIRDITLRALDVFKESDIIFCEDTRRTLKLLNHYSIKKPLKSCHSHNHKQMAEKVVYCLKNHKIITYVSDAGTPGVSDPGAYLVKRVREEGFQITPIPGASALTSLVSVSGWSGKAFTFAGFLSPKAGRRKRCLAELLEIGHRFALFESPHRIKALLKDLSGLAPERKVLLAREMTKKHEEIIEDYAANVLLKVEKRNIFKGEISLLINGS